MSHTEISRNFAASARRCSNENPTWPNSGVDIRLRIVEWDLNGFLRLRGKWNNALRKSSDNDVFLTWEWITSWWKHLGGRNELLPVTVSDDDEILAAACFMRTSSKSLGLNRQELRLVGVKDSDYGGIIIREGKLDCVRIIIDYIRTSADYFKFDSIPENSATAMALGKFLGQVFSSEVRAGEDCHYLPLSKSWQEHYSGLSTKFRENISRQERNLKKDFKVEVEVITAPEDVTRSMKDFFRLHQERWTSKHEPGLFADMNRRNFHLDLAPLFAEQGWLRLFFLTLNGERVAVSYCFNYAKKLYWYLSGFDPAFSRYGVGSVLTAHLIENSIDDGLHEVDFLSGSEPYKERWNTMTRRTVTFLGAPKSLVHNLKRWGFYLGQRIGSLEKP